MNHRGSIVQNVVALPVDDQVVGVHVASWLQVLPVIKDIAPPMAPDSYARHIIRLPDSIVVVEVEARMSVYPRKLSLSQVKEAARDSLLGILEKDSVTPTPAAYANGLEALTQRIAQQMRQHGVEIT